MNDLQGGFPNDLYMNLYTTIYNECSVQNKTFKQNTNGPTILGEELYNSLQNYLKNYLKNLIVQSRKMKDLELLNYYTTQWTNYTHSCKFIHHLFSYLNRHWIKRQQELEKDVYDVYTLSLITWKNDFLLQIKDQLTDAIFDTIQSHRVLQKLPRDDCQVLKNITLSYVLLGIDKKDSHKKTLDVYTEHFEKPFLVKTQQWYSDFASEFIKTHSISEYIDCVYEYLNQETLRTQQYLDQQTLDPLIKICQNTMIVNYLTPIIESCISQFKNVETNQLSKIYSLLLGINNLDQCKQEFHQYVKTYTLEKINALEKLVPQDFTTCIVNVQNYFQNIIDSCFQNDHSFVQEMQRAIKTLVNTNKFTKEVSAPEILVKYSDSLLKKNSKNENIQQCLKDIINVFQFIDDKDVFLKFYSKAFAKRLVNDNTNSSDDEQFMLGLIKQCCGVEYVNKLSKMFIDIQLSQELNQEFKQMNGKCSTKVLTQGSWPLKNPQVPLVLPEQLQNLNTCFEEFYQAKHDGRKLSWMHHLSSGEIKYQGYTFIMDGYGITVLLAFEKSDTRKFEDLLQITGLDSKNLTNVLENLVNAKVLLQTETDNGNQISLNLKYKNKKLRVNLKTQTKTQIKKETDENYKLIEDDRKFIIQAAIVRIMKTRQTIKHVGLIEELIKQVSQLFKPQISEFKKCIDYLIDKEYIERAPGQRDSYVYLA